MVIDERLIGILMDSFSKILLPGLTMTKTNKKYGVMNMKRKYFSILLASVLAIGALSGCSQGSSAVSERSTPAASTLASSAPTASSLPTEKSTSSSAAATETVPIAAKAIAGQAAVPEAPQTMQIRVSANDQSIIFELNDSSAAKSLYEQLPLSIGVENYASNEKIFYPPEKLDTSGTPLLSSGGVGTLGYYAPWADVILFYGSCGPASGLYTLGTVVSGADQIESLSGTIQIDAYTAQ